MTFAKEIGSALASMEAQSFREDVIQLEGGIHGHEIWVATGGRGGKARGSVKNRKVSIRKLLDILSRPVIDNSISYAAYMKLDPDEKAERKAQPGFIITAKFSEGRRKMSHFRGKSAVQVDIDNCTPEQAEYILGGEARINQFAYIWHTTRAHCPEKPRIRMIVPTTRLMDSDEANAITRLLSLYLAEDPDEAIEIPDMVSHKVNQIMYLPSVSRGQEFKADLHDGELLDVDDFLDAHPTWQDISTLPRKETERSAAGQGSGNKMEDPTEKPGLIGAFCRAYTIEEAIEEFLSDCYEPVPDEHEVRYSYLGGTSSNGAVVYDDGLFLQSYHSSDPAEGLHNAWDLVRLHKFGDLDDEAHGNTTPGNMPSFKAMSELALKDDRVRKERAAALAFDVDSEFEDCVDDFDLDVDDLLSTDEDDDDDLPPSPKTSTKKKAKKKKEPPWQERLVLDKADNVEKSKYNAILIVTNDRRIAPTIALNELSGGPDVRAHLRFEKVDAPQPPIRDTGDNTWAGPEFQKLIWDEKPGRKWTDTDTAALAYCLAAPKDQGGYGRDFTNQDLKQAMLLAAEKNRYNPVLERLSLVDWDGSDRIETFFIDWLGCEDNAYHRELAKLWFLGAVTRLYEPGHKFDLVPILGGKQGGGKSGVIECLGMGFFGHLSGDFSNTQKMVESTRGKWILEVPELKGFHRGLIEDIKFYFSGTRDTVRLAYRDNEEDFARRCVYMGTTNQDEYLRDDENRRFCPVLTNVSKWNVVDFDGPNGLKKAIPQLWAEALVMYHRAREAKPHGMLDLTFQSMEARKEAERLQTEAREAQPHESVAEVVSEWLDAPLSAEAVSAGDDLVDEFAGDDEGRKFVRNYVTATTIRRQLGSDPVIRDLKVNPDKVIGSALRILDGWTYLGNRRRMGLRARWFVRAGLDNSEEFVPVETVPGLGAKPEEENLLG